LACSFPKIFLIAPCRILTTLPQEAHLSDSAGQKPAYNLRTLSRALHYAQTSTPLYGLQRALYDGFAMAFATQVCVSGPTLRLACN
jgi:midasin (ATPase involved in ribosome maturation)